ncbi:tRNA uridine-5-carboxymethylaminomethyl(34) synthesis enzyme MnmG [Croceimicrobium hydrocarbonivorans]|uniref:tRNA uridine 5-carboxymethylaminomethyl modification enzyme MnmG n=1 Tax=Croceimicrobium hydrocarbonivorans TaxID=2761580 RepID=A0A7H0VJF0_9FLAO|nr:tRNA uridine-5-carboxymethylaminomethyl(34) synthesis enzyme MnmG [Croceimicrobium hydrocarbonivorans]QNR25848.1 tRNA uridine-5-carboxymethylaminomethyl(34) synthesis enzyme MnmG [Croceimicrobium hydrocarbonivorans]
MINKKYDVIVVGGGHAGAEAAAASANMGAETLLVTMNLQTIGQMSCNPAMGGIAKGQIVREIDALGGLSGIISDKTAIQFRMLNRSKGPAMWSPRVQSDRWRFAEEWRLSLEAIPSLHFFQDMVVDLIVEGEQVKGVKTGMGVEIFGSKVILTNGTFLNGLIHIGDKNYGGGRAGERASTGITERLIQLGFESGRMKTGTPPRVDGRSLDYSKMEEQRGDEIPEKFSFSSETKSLKEQRSCYITYTSPEVHDTLKEGFDRSPMFNGAIQSTGPRYCPSIEDKINRFADKDRHQIFVEPEGWNTVEIYVNGFSTSLPQEVQEKALRKVVGFENVRIFRPGYAIEYDYFPPTQLKHTLETKLVRGLYFAGQINGTTGYEEAASQGLMAGINAVLALKEEEPLVLSRDQAYIGVLIDDLITKGTEEPYRMFTSRAEYRILLRQDNADERLSPLGNSIGLLPDSRIEEFHVKQSKTKALQDWVSSYSISQAEANPILESKGLSPLKQTMKFEKVIARPQLQFSDFEGLVAFKAVVDKESLQKENIERVEIETKYAGYLEKEKEAAAKIDRLEDLKIPEAFDYYKLKSLSYEAREKLTEMKPTSIKEAKKISGVSPADISVLLVYMGR